MYQGRIVELGPTATVVDDPEHPYTQALMSSVLAPEPAYANTRIEGMSSFRPLPLRRPGGDSLMTEEIYRAEHIVKTFGHGKHQVQAVKDVSFGLEQGQVTCIVGESGSGKSTMARMVLGLMPITSGKLIFQGKDVTNLKGRARTEYWRDVQAVFQDPFSAFNQFFTVGKLLDRSMLMVGKKVGQERLEESLGYVGMDLSVLGTLSAPALWRSAAAGHDRASAHDASRSYWLPTRRHRCSMHRSGSTCSTSSRTFATNSV